MDRSPWSVLSTHGLVLGAIARSGPGLTLRDIGTMVGLTERSAFRIVVELEEAGLLESHKLGRRNYYELRPDAPLRHPVLEGLTLGDLLAPLSRRGFA